MLVVVGVVAAKAAAIGARLNSWSGNQRLGKASMSGLESVRNALSILEL